MYTKVIKLPFYLPLNTEFSTSSISTIPDTVSTNFIIDNFVGDGASITFTEKLEKLLIVSGFSNVIKEHVFVRLESKSNLLYPILIKSFDIDNKSLVRSDSALLIRKGIEEALKTNFIDPFETCSFKSTLYMDYAVKSCIYPAKMHDEDLLSLESVRNTLKYVNNEGKPDSFFDFNYFMYSLTNPTYNPRIDEFTTKECPYCEVYSQFNPDINYNLDDDYLTSFSIQHGRMLDYMLENTLNFNKIVHNKIDEKDSIITEHVEEKKDNYIVFAGASNNSSLFSNGFEAAIYNLYESILNTPCTDIYARYKLESGVQSWLQPESKFANIYTGGYKLGVNIGNLNWINNITFAVDELVSSLTHCNLDKDIMTNDVYVDIYYQEYHALAIVHIRDIKITIIFDMVVLAMLTKSLIREPDMM